MGALANPHLLGAVAATVAASLFSVIFYRLVFHPLAGFPGPRLAAITRLYEAYYDIYQDGQYEHRIAEMHRKYGPIVRISPHELHIKDPSYYEKLFRHEGRWNKYQWAIAGHNAEGSILFTSDHDLHKARRQPLNTFFSKSRVMAHQELILSHLNRLCERICEVADTGNVIDIGAAMSALQRDVSTEFLLGKNYKNLEQKDFGAGMTGFMQAGGKIWRITKHLPWYGPLMLSIPKEFIIKHGGDVNLSNWMLYTIDSEGETNRLLRAAAGLAEDKGPHTIVHEIVRSSLPLKDKSLQRVFRDVVTVTGAGFESTASVLRLILFNVWSNPEILSRLQSELAQLSNDSPDVRALEQLPYLTGILMEGMRLSPGLGTRLQRVAPDRDLFYNTWRIPAGTAVGMTTLDMHMDEALYPEPWSFSPERWIDPSSRKQQEKVFAPFSRGSRICLGMHLAWAELYLVVSTLALRFDFKFPGIAKDHFEIESDQFIISIKGKAVLRSTVETPGNAAK